jgi:hypothetical protein
MINNLPSSTATVYPSLTSKEIIFELKYKEEIPLAFLNNEVRK